MATLDCDEICACRQRNILNRSLPFTVDHYRGSDSVKLSHSLCTLGELLPAESLVNTTEPIAVTVLINSYFAPPVILITMVTNVLVCIVLTRKNMISPTNVLLLVMAFVDMITGLVPLPWYLLIAYARHTVVSSLCSSHYVANLLNLMVTTLPTMCHTISIWLTVMLAVQRWIYITFPTSVKRICSVKRSIVSVIILAILVIAFFTITQLLLSGSIYFRLRQLENPSASAVVSCSVDEHKNFFIVAMVTRTLLVNIIPSILLTIVTILLVKGLHETNKRRQQLLRGNKTANRKRQDNKANTTLMLTIIVSIFLLVELPMTLIMTIYVLNIANVQLNSTVGNFVFKSVPYVNFIILVSYPINFFIYCLMSTQFRQTFASLFNRGAAAGKQLGVASRVRQASEFEASSRTDSYRRSERCHGDQETPEAVALVTSCERQ